MDLKKNFGATTEFFGGMMNDTKKKTNVALDKYIFSLYRAMLGEEPLEKFLEKYEDQTTIKEVLQVISYGFKKEWLLSNINFYNNSQGKNCLAAPLRIFYDITYQCNLRCKHCFTSSGNQNPNEMSLQQKLIF